MVTAHTDIACVDPLDTRPAVAMFCQIRYGAGHWVRSAALAQALARTFDVTIAVSGTMSPDLELPEGVAIEALPAASERFTSSGAAGSPPLHAALVALLERIRPAAFLIEYFPFGRQNLAFDMARCLAKLRMSGRRPLLVSSVRDIQQTRLTGQDWLNRLTCDFANRYFDAVLVHTDPAIVSFEETFPLSARLTVPVHATGYVAPAASAPAEAAARERVAVVSAGGGAGGDRLLLAAVEAQRSTDLARDLSLRVFAGTYLPDETWRRLQELARDAPRLDLRRWSPAMASELARAAVSVSRCGYNTALELIRARVPALVVPYATAGEDEQTFRATRLEQLGVVRVLHEDRLTPDSLAREIRRTAQFEPRAIPVDLDGGRRSAEILMDLVRARVRTTA